jgi:hypothetical protein
LLVFGEDDPNFFDDASFAGSEHNTFEILKIIKLMMKERLPFLLMLLLLTGFSGSMMAQETVPFSQKVMAPIPTEARRLALETAGAFENDGFRIRDGEWGATLSKGVPVFLQVSLFAGENYWFVAASPVTGTSLRLKVYDASGKSVKSESWHSSLKGEGTRSAEGVAPTQSGKYFIGVEGMHQTGSPVERPIDFSLVYCYK